MSGDKESRRSLVKDDGPGLTQEDLGRLFGRFQRLSAKPTAGDEPRPGLDFRSSSASSNCMAGLSRRRATGRVAARPS
jgi:hypothetical protein